MLIREAMGVFWRTLKDTWEELYMIAIVNLVWLFAWGAPIGLGYATKVPALAIAGLVLGLAGFAITTVGVYFCTDRVSRGKTFSFADFREGVRTYWKKSLLWMLANILIIGMFALNIWFYPNAFEGGWVTIVVGIWIALLALWVTAQVYFWPMMMQQVEPSMRMALKNAAFLMLANPFYAFFMVSFAAVFLVLSVGLTLPLIFVGMGLQGLLGCNAVIQLLISFGKIEDPRPKPVKR